MNTKYSQGEKEITVSNQQSSYVTVLVSQPVSGQAAPVNNQCLSPLKRERGLDCIWVSGIV
jgi:hypothetical protein